MPAVKTTYSNEVSVVQPLMQYGSSIMNNAFIAYEDTMLTGHYREKHTPQRALPGNTMQLAHTSSMMFYFDVHRNETCDFMYV